MHYVRDAIARAVLYGIATCRARQLVYCFDRPCKLFLSEVMIENVFKSSRFYVDNLEPLYYHLFLVKKIRLIRDRL